MFPKVASRYENVTFSRKVSTRKKNVDLLGLGHPLIDALIQYYKSDPVNGELLNIKGDGISPCLVVRYLFTVTFEDGSKKEFYEKFNIEGELPEYQDIFLLKKHLDNSEHIISRNIEEKIIIHIKNKEALLHSRFEGVVNIWNKCLGIQNIN